MRTSIPSGVPGSLPRPDIVAACLDVLLEFLGVEVDLNELVVALVGHFDDGLRAVFSDGRATVEHDLSDFRSALNDEGGLLRDAHLGVRERLLELAEAHGEVRVQHHARLERDALPLERLDARVGLDLRSEQAQQPGVALVEAVLARQRALRGESVLLLQESRLDVVLARREAELPRELREANSVGERESER